MKYIVKKSWFAVEEGQVLNETAFGDLLREDGYCPVQKWAIKQALDQGFIEPYEEKAKRWRAEIGCEYWIINNDWDGAHKVSRYDNEAHDIEYGIGNHFKSKETAEAVAEALKLFFEWLHTPIGENCATENELQRKIKEARKLVLADNEVSDE